MEQVRSLVREEGREARNLLAFNISIDDSTFSPGKVSRKPPCAPRLSEPRRTSKSSLVSAQGRTGARVRSASTGRDKRSELRARYWALLFGNLQRSIVEIYNTVESHESTAECQEVILVLENYTREFNALSDWFRLKWEYENTPILQRPTSLTWDVCKTNTNLPKNRSGKSSPSISSGRSSPKSPRPNFVQNKSKSGNTSPMPPEYIETEMTEKIQKVTEKMFQMIERVPKGEKVPKILEIGPKTLEKASKIAKIPNSEKDPQTLEKDPNTIEKVFHAEKTPNPIEKVPNSLEKVPNLLENVPQIPSNDSTPTNETPIKNLENVQSIDFNKTVESENSILSPSEDQKTYVECFKKFGIETVDKGISTDVVEPYKPLVKKINVIKINQECQTDPDTEPKPDTESTEKRINPKISKNHTLDSSVKTFDTKISKNHDSETEKKTKTSVETKVVSKPLTRPAYSMALSRNCSLNKTLVTKTVVNPLTKSFSKPEVPKSSVRNFPMTNRTQTRSALTSKVTATRTGLARSKTIGDIKSSNANSKMEKPLRTQKPENAKLNLRNLRKSTDLCSSSAETIINTYDKDNRENQISSSAENLNAKGPKETLDGWLTVKCRSRFRNGAKRSSDPSHWTNRFNQVSATASLPALALLPEKSNESGITKGTKDTLNTLKSQAKKTETRSFVRRSNTTLNARTSLHDSRLSKFSSERNKLNFKSFNCDKENKRPSHAKEMFIDSETESESKVMKEDFASEEEHRKETQRLTEEEAMLTKQIAELQSSDIDVETETDGTETDGELQGEADCEGESEEQEDGLSLEARYEPVLAGMSWAERINTLSALEALVARHPGRALQLHQKLSSPSRRRSLPEILRRYQAKQARAQQQRQALQQEKALKLQTLLARVEEVKAAKVQLIEEKRKRMEQRLQKATQNRNKHLKKIVRKAHDEEEKLKEIAFINELEAQNKRHDFFAACKDQSVRLQGLHEDRKKKLEEKAAKEAAVEERRKALEKERLERLDRLQDERRQRNERIDQQQAQRERERQELAREKARDREERLSALHAQQLANTQELQKRISQKQEESARRHEENMEHIRQKALELSILRCYTDDYHTPENTPYVKQKFCTLCNIMIKSEVYLLSHLRGRLHQENIKSSEAVSLAEKELEQYNLKQIVDAPVGKEDPKDTAAKERGKTYKKRLKKIRQRMSSKGAEYEVSYKPSNATESSNKRSINRNVNTIGSITNQATQGWSTSTGTQLDRILNEMSRLFVKGNKDDIAAFQVAGGFAILGKLLTLAQDTNCPASIKSLTTACNVWQLTCKTGTSGADNCKYVIMSNRLTPVLDLLNVKLQGIVFDDGKLPSDPLCTSLMQVLTCVLSNAPDDVPTSRLQDVVSFAVCLGVVERLSQCCQSIRGPVHDNPASSSFLLASLDLLAALAARCPSDEQDPTHLVDTLHGTEFVGVVSMLYGTLLPSGISPRCQGDPPQEMPQACIKLATATFRLLRRIAELDLKKFQEVLGAEGISLQFRHIAGHLLWSCASPPAIAGKQQDQAALADAYQDLLHEVIHVIGYFAVANHENQMLLISGHAPSVLQQLCTLPFPYFSVEKLSKVLYPTLLACCAGNPQTKEILKQELSYESLTDYRKSENGRNDRLIKLLPTE